MPKLSRSQVLVYGAVAVALLLVGARAIRAEGGGTSYASGSSSPAASPAGGAPTGFSVTGGGPGVVVDVTGAVHRPGVYSLPAGARVDDAVSRAGGATGAAELDAINLAARLSDGQQVAVPLRAAAGGTAVPGAPAEEGPIGLGSATAEQLETIDGIGPVTAGDIIEFRDAHGGLSSIDQLDDVSGIGPTTMKALRDRLQP